MNIMVNNRLFSLLWYKYVHHPEPMFKITTINITVKMLSTSSISKLTDLRTLMGNYNLSAYYVPSEDAHQVSLNFNPFLLSFVE